MARFDIPNNDDQTKKQSVKPRGLARVWNDADIARMTGITKLDVVNAARWWRKHAVPRYRKILDTRSKPSNDAEQ